MEPNAHVARDRSNGNSRDLYCTFLHIQLGSGEPEPNCRPDNPIPERVVDRETSILEEANMRFLSRMQELVSVILFAPTSRTTGLTTYAPHVCKHFGSNSPF